MHTIALKTTLLLLLLTFSNHINAQKRSRNYTKSMTMGIGCAALTHIGAMDDDYPGILIYYNIEKIIAPWSVSARTNFIQSSRKETNNPKYVSRIRNMSIWELQGNLQYIFVSSKRGTSQVGIGASLRHQSITTPETYQIEGGIAVNRVDRYETGFHGGTHATMNSTIKINKRLSLYNEVDFGFYSDSSASLYFSLGLAKKF